MGRYVLAIDRGTSGIALDTFTQSFSVVLMGMRDFAARAFNHSLKLEQENSAKSGWNHDFVHPNVPIVQAKVKDGVFE